MTTIHASPTLRDIIDRLKIEDNYFTDDSNEWLSDDYDSLLEAIIGCDGEIELEE